jgi:tetrahydromethanopterin S-methyltransferase subunit H
VFKFDTGQKVYNISGVEIGGQPGERPTVLVGSIFFAGHRIVQDPAKGIFDRDKAAALLDREAKASAETGNPRIIDTVGDTAEALIRYIEFVAEHTRSPILIDSPSQRARMETVRHFKNTEIIPRLIYNSIAEDHTDEELACIKTGGIKSAVILAFSTRAIKPEAKLKLLQDDLLPAAKAAGIENILVDAGVLDVPSISWVSLAIREIKENMGYPTGCAPANAIYTWKKMRDKGTPLFQAVASSVFATTKSLGADFIFYGSVHGAPWVYPAVATMDALLAYGGRFTGVQPATKEHPLYKIF